MPINTSSLALEIRRLGLDAEGSNYYSDERDIAPAINAACRWAVQAFVSEKGLTKFKDEALRELKHSRVFLTSSASRVKIPDDVWSIEAVYPLPTVSPTGFNPSSPSNQLASAEQTGAIHLDAEDSAKRLTVEEWMQNKRNPFHPGNIIQEQSCSEDKWRFGYLDMFTYPNEANQGLADENMIEIRPHIPRRLVTVFTVNVPDEVTAPGGVYSPTSIPFATVLRTVLAEKALNYIARRQGDGTTIYSTSAAEIAAIERALS